MKIIAVLMLVLATSLQAKVGWTLNECKANYGQPVKTEKAWCGGTAYSFINNGMYIYAIIPTGQSKVADISYFSNTVAAPLTDTQCEKLWVSNQGAKGWDSGSASDWLNYNGRKVYNKLGQEKFEHIVQFDRAGKYGNVGNRKDNGYQVRTVKQFHQEQKVIKALVKKAPVGAIIATL